MAREIEINGPPGETGGSLKLFAVGSDTVAQTIATVTERTNKKGSYLATVTVAPGDYDYRFFGSDSALLSYGTRRILQPDGVYAEPPIGDETVLFETTIKSIVQADPPIYELEDGPTNDDVIIGNPVKIRQSGTTYTIDSTTVTDWDSTNMELSCESVAAFTAAVGDVVTVMLGSTVDNTSIAVAVWDRVLSGNHDTADTAGKLVQDIFTDTDTTLPGLLTTITGDIATLQATVDNLENLTQADIRAAIGMATANMDTQLAAIMAAAPPSAVAVAIEVWNRAVSLHQAPGSAGAALSAASATSPTAEDIRIEMDANSSALTSIFNVVDALEDLSAAEAKSEVLDALADLYLDRLFAVACDITADAQTDSLFAQMLEKNANLARFTAAALALGPTGGGGGTTDWTATEREQMRWALGLDGTTSAPVVNSPNLVVANTIPTKEEIRTEIDNNSTSIAAIPTVNLSQADVRTAVGLATANLDTQLSGLDGKLDTTVTAVTTTIPTTLSGINPLDAAGIRSAVGLANADLDTQLAALGTQLGAGAFQVTLTFENSADSSPLQNVQVRLQEGATVVFGQTDANGEVTFGLDDATYSVTATKPGFTPITAGVVTTSSGVPSPTTFQLTTSGITPPAAAHLSTGVMYVYNNAGALEGDVWFTVQMTAGPGILGQSHDTEPRSFQADPAGFLQVTGLVRGASYSIFRGTAGNPNGNPAVPFTVEDVASFDLPSGVLGFE